MAGVRWLFHVAADYRLWARDPDEIVENNVTGTRIVMEAAQERRRRAHRLHLQRGDARMPRPAARPPTKAGRCRRARPSAPISAASSWPSSWSEKMVAQGLPAVIVNPSTPIGPRDVKPTPTGRHDLRGGGRPHAGLRRYRPQHGACRRRCRRPHRGAERGRTGERYILGGQNASLAEILAEVASRPGRRPPRIKMPRGGGLSARAMRRKPLRAAPGASPSSPWTACACRRSACSSPPPRPSASWAIRARPYAEGIRDAIEWFRQAGHLRR